MTRSLSAFGGERLRLGERDRLVDAEAARLGAPQRGEVGRDAERAAEIGGERPDVGTLAAADDEPREAQPGAGFPPIRAGSGCCAGSRARRSSASTRTRRGARSIDSPARATSWSLRPPTRTAEYIGGTCAISPTKRGRTARIAAAVRPAGSPVSTTRPSASSVSVAAPNATVASYALSASARYCWSFTASSTHTARTPVAAGSSVPAWPARDARSSRRTRCTTSKLVGPAGLSTTRTPEVVTARRASPSRALP